MFEKIYETDINGREFELVFPLLLISNTLSIFDEFLEIIKKIVKERRSEDLMESRDVVLFNFISQKSSTEWYRTRDLTLSFKTYINYEPDDETRNWLNIQWLGHALKRLNLIVQKHRSHDGVEVVLNVNNAKEKLKLFS